MYVGMGIEQAIRALADFLIKNLQVAHYRPKDDEPYEPVRYIPDSFGELMQMERSISGLWGLGDVYFALADAQKAGVLAKEPGDATVESCQKFFKIVYEKRQASKDKYLGLPDRIRVPLDRKALDPTKPTEKSDVLAFKDRDINDPAHIVASLYYLKMTEFQDKRIVKTLLDDWYESKPEAKGPGWPIFPKNGKDDTEDKLVDFVATLQVVSVLVEAFAKATDADVTRLVSAPLAKTKLHDAWVFSRQQAKKLSEQPAAHKFTYSNACRALLALASLLQMHDACHSLLNTEREDLKADVKALLDAVIEQLRGHMIASRRIHDRSGVYKRSDGYVVQYSGVGSAFILYAVLVAIDALEAAAGYIQHPVVRTLLVQVLQQIVTQEHVTEDSTRTLEGFAPYKPEGTARFDIRGAYVFDESAPDRPDAHEFILFWQSAYALQGLIKYAQMTCATEGAAVDASCLDALRGHRDMEKRFWSQLASIRFWPYVRRLIRNEPLAIAWQVFGVLVGTGLIFLLIEFHRLSLGLQRWIALLVVIVALLMMVLVIPFSFWSLGSWVKDKARERQASPDK